MDYEPLISQAIKGDQVTVTDDHLTLLRNTWIQWDYLEFGAPEIDPKKPYGNSDVLGDLRELLPHLTEEDAVRTHAELVRAIEAMFSTGQLVTGRYERTSKYTNSWRYLGR